MTFVRPIDYNVTRLCGEEYLNFYVLVIDLNSVHKFKLNHKTSIVFSFENSAQCNLICFNYKVEPVLVNLCSGVMCREPQRNY